MSLFNKNTSTSAAPAVTNKENKTMSKSIFGGITKPKAAFAKNYFTPGRYKVELTKVKVAESNNPRYKGFPMGLAVFSIVESAAPSSPSPDSPQPVGAEVSTTKYFAGPGADYALRDWRNLCCAILGIDEGTVAWQHLTEEEVSEFEAACDDIAENPEKYYGKQFLCNCVERIVEKNGETKRYTNQFYKPLL